MPANSRWDLIRRLRVKDVRVYSQFVRWYLLIILIRKTEIWMRRTLEYMVT